MRMAISATGREKTSAADAVIGTTANAATRARGGGITTRITSSQRSDMTAADHLSSGLHSLPRPVNRHPARLRFSDAAAIFKLLVIRKIIQQNSAVDGRTSLVCRPGRRTSLTPQVGGRRPRPQHLCVGLKQTKAAQFTNCLERYRSSLGSGTSQFQNSS